MVSKMLRSFYLNRNWDIGIRTQLVTVVSMSVLLDVPDHSATKRILMCVFVTMRTMLRFVV